MTAVPQLVAVLLVSRNWSGRYCGCSRTRTAARIQIELPHFVQQRFVTDAQHFRGVLAAPARFFESLRDGFRFGFIFQSADERFQSALLARRRCFRLWRETRLR